MALKWANQLYSRKASTTARMPTGRVKLVDCLFVDVGKQQSWLALARALAAGVRHEVIICHVTLSPVSKEKGKLVEECPVRVVQIVLNGRCLLTRHHVLEHPRQVVADGNTIDTRVCIVSESAHIPWQTHSTSWPMPCLAMHPGAMVGR